jgi:outer membrane protein OmpA-like peptidoglycan-associated protein
MSRALIAGFTVALLTASAHSVLPAKANDVLLAQSEGEVQDQNSQQDQATGEDQDNKKKKRKRQQEQQQQGQQEQQQQQQQPQGAEDQGQGQGETKQQRRRRQQQQQQGAEDQGQQQPQLEQQQGQDQGETKQQRRRRQQQQQQQQQQGQQEQQQQQGQPQPQLEGQPQQQQQQQPQPQQAQPDQQPAPEGDQVGMRDAMRFLNDRRPARSLSDAELRRRIAVGRSLLGKRDLRDKVRGRVQSLTAEAQNELANRGGQAQSADQGQGQGQDQGGGQQQGSLGQDQGQGMGQGQGGRQDRNRQPGMPQGGQDQGSQQGGQQAGSDPDRYFSDRRAAATLNDRELRYRIRTGRSLMQSGQGQRGQIEARLNEDSRELRNRLQEVNGGAMPGGGLDQPSAAEGEARRLLSDRRPANGLDDQQLRDRVQRTRGVLAAEGLSNEMSERLRDRLREDRDALRDRVAEREDRQRDRQWGADQGGDQGGFDYGDRGRSFGRDELTRRLLQDRRPSQALNVRQLNRRIDAARLVLDDRNMRGPDRFRIEDGLRSDRRELRMRLIAGRRDRYDEYRREGGINIVIVPGAPPRPRPNIAAAEVDDEMIEEQLIAPPTREIDRRYSVEEIRERPALRQTMPGVEIDTIHFGFNEAFVREEEIENVERIGRILEKIVIANPDEVFMIEGHTDAVGSDPYNLDLSQQRADSVKQSLTEFFNIAPQNLETIGYGEQFLKIPIEEEEPENRRVTVRRITPLLAGRGD